MPKQPWFWPFAVVAVGCFIYSITAVHQTVEGKAAPADSSNRSDKKAVSFFGEQAKPVTAAPQAIAQPTTASGEDSPIVVPDQAEYKGKHPYFPPTSSEKQSAVGSANSLLAKYTEEQWLNLVPKQSPRTVLNDPPDGSKDWGAWDPAKPDQIKTQKGLMLPDQYPITKKSVKVMNGKTVQVPFVQYNGKSVMVQARIDYEKSHFMSANLPILANAYLSTGDEKYARRVAVALDAWATVIPDFYMTGKNKSELISADDIGKYYNTDIQRVSDHNGVAHEMHSGEIYAFDRIYESKSLTQLSKEKGYDVRDHIQNDMFLNVTNWLVKYQSLKVHTATNLSGAVEAIARVATVTAQPSLIEWMDKYLTVTVGDNFKRDGMFPESFSYHAGYAKTNASIAKLVEYYFKVHQADNSTLKAMKDKTERQVAFLDRANEVQKKVAFPDGDLPPFHDTTKGGASPRSSTKSQLLPAYGHLMLGDGTADKQTQFNINFNDKGNHVHPNVLSSTLYAFGKELLGGIRYSRTPARNFSRSTISTNTVVVNRADQFRSNDQGPGNTGHVFTEGNLSLYEPGLNGIEASEVYSSFAYPGTVDRYQRLNILNTIDASHPYLVDLFKVTGGNSHEYFLHGSTQFDQTAKASFPLQKIDKDFPMLADNEKWTEPVKEGENKDNWYGMFREMSSGQSPGKWDVTFQGANGGVSTRTFMLDDGKNQVYLGKSPHGYRDKVYDNIYQFWRPSLIVKREEPGKDKLDSLFISVTEPLKGESVITGIDRLSLKEENPEHIALSVKFKDGREDVMLINMNQAAITGSTAADKEFSTSDGKYSLSGRIGIAAKVNSVVKPFLIAASKFQYAGETLTQDTPSYNGTIKGAVRREEGSDVDALLTDANNLPTGDALKGKWAALTFGSYKVVPDSSGKYPMDIREQKGISEWYQIDHIEKRNGQTYIVMSEDHALSVKDGKTKELLRPQRTFEGMTAFRIDFSRTKP